MGYSESLRQLIRSAEASESPDEILAVAERLVADGFPDDAAEWFKWYAHLRPGAPRRAPAVDSETLAVLKNLSRSIESLSPKAPGRLLGYLQEAQRAVDAGDVAAAERALLRYLQQRANFDEDDGGGGVPAEPHPPTRAWGEAKSWRN